MLASNVMYVVFVNNHERADDNFVVLCSKVCSGLLCTLSHPIRVSPAGYEAAPHFLTGCNDKFVIQPAYRTRPLTSCDMAGFSQISGHISFLQGG